MTDSDFLRMGGRFSERAVHLGPFRNLLLNLGIEYVGASTAERRISAGVPFGHGRAGLGAPRGSQRGL